MKVYRIEPGNARVFKAHAREQRIKAGISAETMAAMCDVSLRSIYYFEDTSSQQFSMELAHKYCMIIDSDLLRCYLDEVIKGIDTNSIKVGLSNLYGSLCTKNEVNKNE